MKKIGLIAIMIASMICMSQFAHAYTLVNANMTVTVSASGDVTKINGTDMMQKGAIGYLKPGTTTYTVLWISDLKLLWVNTATPNQIMAQFRVVNPSTANWSNIQLPGDNLVVKVTSKLVAGSTCLDQRYAVEYGDGNPLVELQLSGIRLFEYLEVPGMPSWAGTAPLAGTSSSSFQSPSPWPNPVDTMIVGAIRRQGYMPLNPDDKQYGTAAEIQAAIMSGQLTPGASHTGDAAALQWNLPPLPPAGAQTGSAVLELRTDVVPEPCTMVLLGTGLFGLFGLRRRKA